MKIKLMLISVCAVALAGCAATTAAPRAAAPLPPLPTIATVSAEAAAPARSAAVIPAAPAPASVVMTMGYTASVFVKRGFEPGYYVIQMATNLTLPVADLTNMAVTNN